MEEELLGTSMGNVEEGLKDGEGVVRKNLYRHHCLANWLEAWKSNSTQTIPGRKEINLTRILRQSAKTPHPIPCYSCQGYLSLTGLQ